METKEIGKKEPLNNGDKLILTFDLLNPFQMFAGIINPQAIGIAKEEAIIQAITELKSKSNENGFVIDDYSVSGNKLKVNVTVFDKEKIVKQKGLGVVPVAVVVVEALASVIVVVALAWGVNAALSKVEKITSNPIPALAILGIVVIFLVREITKSRGAKQ